LLVAVRKDVINSYVLLSARSVDPVIIDVDYFALEKHVRTQLRTGAEELSPSLRWSTLFLYQHHEGGGPDPHLPVMFQSAVVNSQKSSPKNTPQLR